MNATRKLFRDWIDFRRLTIEVIYVAIEIYFFPRFLFDFLDFFPLNWYYFLFVNFLNKHFFFLFLFFYYLKHFN